MTVETLAIELETAYWQNNITRVAVGDAPREDEAFAARAHLPVLCRHTARAAVKWARRAGRPARYAGYAPAFVAATVARETEHAMQRDVRCGVLIETIGLLLLRSLLQNLAWRFAAWLLSDSTHEDRPDLICRMEVTD